MTITSVTTELLTDEQLRTFREDGVVLIPAVVPKERCDATIDAIMEFIDGSLDDPASWYRPPVSPVALIEFFHHQLLWDNRTDPRVYQVFAECYGNEKLWVDMNRVSLRPPTHPDHPMYDTPGFIHWDIDTTGKDVADLDGPPTSIQGVLYLTDVDPDRGPFHCVPAIYRNLRQYLADRPAGSDPHLPDLTGHTPSTYPGKAGDLLVFDNRLPHGAQRSNSTEPRMVQYIVMSPERSHDQAEVAERIACYAGKTTPRNCWGDPRGREKLTAPAALTPLGRRLLGLDSW